MQSMSSSDMVVYFANKRQIIPIGKSKIQDDTISGYSPF